MYRAEATSQTPALIIYLLDVSGSMVAPIKSGDPKITTRIEALESALAAARLEMIDRSTKGIAISPRYNVAMLAYSDDVYDVLGGIKPINEIAKLPPLKLETFDHTCTRKAFEVVLELLKTEISKMDPGCPAPLVCHLTDGEVTKGSGDPSEIIEEIKNLEVPDGKVLVENVFISDKLRIGTDDVSNWHGVRHDDNVNNDYANQLIQWSSEIPEKYHQHMREYGMDLQKKSVLMFPGVNADFVQVAFVVSTFTDTYETPYNT